VTDNHVAAALVELEDHAFDLLIEVGGYVGRSAEIDLTCRHKTLKAAPMSMSNPPLILRVTRPLTTSPS
jgi:hypothetical protein